MEKDPQTYAILGAATEVHRELGHGFLEPAYQSAMERELLSRKLPFHRELPCPIIYKGEPLDCSYRADFCCYSEIIVETKSIKKLTDIEIAQLMNYLKATGLRRGLLINFGPPSLEYRRVVYDPPNQKSV